MKVLFIDVNCKHSSTGKIVYSLYQHLRKTGHTAAICYGRGEWVQEPGIYKFGLDWETYLHAGLARLTGKNGYYSPFSTRRLIHYIEQFKPDLIHIHELHAYFVNIFQLLDYIKHKKIPVVWTFHCEYMYTGKCGNAFECEQWKTQCNHCPAVRQYPSSLWFDYAASMFTDKKQSLVNWPFTIVTPSSWLANRVKQSFLSKHPIQIIPNGIDTEQIFYPRTEKPKLLNKLHPNKKVILSVAPDILSTAKGGQNILKLSQELKDKPYEFVLIGTEETKRYADNVLFISRTKDQDELARWYSLADVFLICSKMETFGLTVAEAMACGTPVCGFNCGAPTEIAPAPYGHFVPYGDIEGLKNLILQANTTAEKRQGVCRYAHVHYSRFEMDKKYMLLYQKIANE